MKRHHRAALAQDTLAILQRGDYQTPTGRTVAIADDVADAVRDSRLYRPADFPDDLPLATPLAGSARLEITTETTLQAAKRLCGENPSDDPLALNFASAKNPGGGFLGGSQAQEESLARSSALYPCIAPMTEMYDYNRGRPTCLYSHYMIHSPRVPVFRDDAGTLLETPYRVSILTAAAVNAGAVRGQEAHRLGQIKPTMRARTARVLWVGHRHGHRTLILGAWGCGVFQNNPAMVAGLFADELRPGGRFANVFERVVFAVYGRSEEQEIVTAFRAALGS
jgi:uncharacterized protein (TIGR02452 family)